MEKGEIRRISEADRILLKRLFLDECRFHLNDEVMDEFLDLGTVIEVNRGEMVCQAGLVDSNIYVMIKGIVSRWRWNHNKEIVDTFSTPGTMFMEYHSYYASQDSHAFFEACCPSRLLKVSARDFDSLIERSHSFARWALNMAYSQLYSYEIRELNFNGDVYQRYETLMRDRPEIIREVPMKVVAAYLGVSPQYLSSLRKEWLGKRK
ncbi:MAG: Crp/Fnr family transcriptional regulator [Bacteroides sp.]|nr:Crp/Fnr family transcriptional regulator [Bacteroides sp.]